MSEVDEYLLENEKILLESRHGFLPSLFDEEILFLTNLRSIKILSPGFFGRKTFLFLPHAVSRGHGLAPVWNLTNALLYGIGSFIIFSILLAIIGAPEEVVFTFGFILAAIIAYMKARVQAFVVFGEPAISMVINDNLKSENALKIVTKLQDEIRNKK